MVKKSVAREKEFKSVSYLKKTFLILFCFWTFTIILFLAFTYYEEKQAVFDIAVKECLTDFNKDVQYRLWATKHGGVYAPITGDTPPNPYLSHIPERDINTPSGKKLTLINPAYMTRQVFELGKGRFGLGHITSLNPIRKENAPDEWEIKALKSFQKGSKERIEITKFEGEDHVRYMAPFVTEKGCLKCHAAQGYKVGDIRGGICISLPWEPFNSLFWSEMKVDFLGHIIIWLLGITGLFIAYVKMKANSREKEFLNEEIRNNEATLNNLLNGIKESALLIDVNGIVLAANDTVIDRINNGDKDIIGKDVYTMLNDDTAKAMRKYVEMVIDSRQPVDFEDIRFGRVIQNYLTPILDDNGNVSKVALIGIDVTKQKQNENALRESEIKFRTLIESSNDVISLIDKSGEVIYESSSHERVMGYKVKERIGKNTFELIHPDDKEMISSLLAKILKTDGWIQMPHVRVLHADKTYHWIEGSANNKIDDPNIGAIIINYRDITEKKKSEDILEHTLQHLKYHVENTPLAVIEFNNKYEIIEWSSKAEEMFGWKANEVMGKHINDFRWVMEEDKEKVAELSAMMTASLYKSNININRNYKKDGSIIICSWYNSAMHDSDGQLVSVYSLVEDITELIETQKSLHESEMSLRESQRVAHVGHWTWDITSNKVYWSEEMKRIFGLNPDEYLYDLGKILEECIHEEDKEAVFAANLKVIKDQNPQTLQYRVVRSKDDIRTVMAIPGEKVVDKKGNIIKLSGIVQDVTEHEKVESTLKFIAQKGWQVPSEELFNSLVIHLAEVLGVDYAFIDQLNEDKDSVKTLSFYAKGKLTSNIKYELKNTPCENVIGKSLCSYIKGVQQQFPNDDLLKEMGVESYSGIPLWNSKGEPLGLVAVMDSKPIENCKMLEKILQIVAVRAASEIEHRIDDQRLLDYHNHLEELVLMRTSELDATNTDLKREILLKEEAENQLKDLLNKEKDLSNLKSRFISTASHEFRTPLTSLLSSSELLQKYQGKWSNEKINEHFDRIKHSVTTLTKLLDDIISVNKAESGKVKFLPEELNLRQLCESVISNILLPFQPQPNLSFNFSCKSEIYTLDKKQIELIIQNLLSNAIKYSPSGKKITFDVETSDGNIILSIKDEGIGIPNQDIARVFEPFYRAGNADDYDGTGLGLSIVKHAVDLHKGKINVESGLGNGTTFKVMIPFAAN